MTRNDAVAELVSDLTREEKLDLVRGATDPEGTATGYVPGVDRLDVPEIRLVDGPMGVRAGGFGDELPATAFPSTLALAATFDPDLAREQGRVMAREAKARDQDALLGPGTNLIRVPHCGRNFEYFSEDPLLSGAFAAAVVGGIESEDVIATVKHYVANNQEHQRVNVSAEVDERTLRELYLPPFRAAVEAGTGSVMTAYNRVNGTYMSDHDYLVGDVLKDEWGFEGYVVSDWFGTASTVDAANAGLDLEMPGVSFDELFGGPPDEDAHDFDPEDVDLDEMTPDDVDVDEMGPEGMDLDDVDFEDFDVGEMMNESGGMPDPTNAGRFGEPLAEAIEAGEVPTERLDDMVARILGAMDRIGLLDGERDREGALDAPDHRALAERIAARGTVLMENDGVLPLETDADVAVIGPNVHEAKVGGGGSSAVEPFVETAPVEGMTDRAGGDVAVARGVPEVEEATMFGDGPFGGDGDEGPDPEIEDAVVAAREADVAVVFVRDAATEGRDRDSLRLPGEQDALVAAVADAADRTVVVLNASGPVELPWRDEVDALLSAWYPGQAHGDAAAAVLYGDVDPAGRLPVTFAAAEEYPTNEERRYPGVDERAHYEEGIFVGYRHFDREGVDPAYPFGHGESYADFEYGNAEAVDDSTVRIEVENVADRRGREVVQAYVRPPETDDAERPVRELAGFEAVSLDAGERRALEVGLDDLALARYDDGWTLDPGEYVVEVARSSRDVRAETTVER